MDKLVNHRQLIRGLLKECAGYKPAYGEGEVNSEIIVDADQNYFQLMRVGWLNKKRVHGAIINNKIRI